MKGLLLTEAQLTAIQTRIGTPRVVVIDGQEKRPKVQPVPRVPIPQLDARHKKRAQEYPDYSAALYMQLSTTQLPKATREYQFASPRKWRFDIAWPAFHVALEIEGGAFSLGAHVRGVHFLQDMEKYNAAALLGWRLFRVTPQHVNDGRALQLVEAVLKGVGEALRSSGCGTPPAARGDVRPHSDSHTLLSDEPQHPDQS